MKLNYITEEHLHNLAPQITETTASKLRLHQND